MSHFFGIVICPKETKSRRSAVEKTINKLLAPYSENENVPEYQKKCRCGERAAMAAARRAAEEKVGSPDEIRRKFHKENGAVPLPKVTAEVSAEEEKRLWEDYNKKEREHDKLWKKAIQPYVDAQKEFFDAHPELQKPDPDCYQCHGKGAYKSTYNPKAKWDWWVIGGRWTGAFAPDYNPNEDPRNIEKCDICNGTGTRTMPTPADPNWKPKKGECNGCDGKGKRVKWSLAEFDRDIMEVSKIPETVIPFCVVTPEGRWYEKGEMGWWAMVEDEKDEDAWKSEARNLLNQHKDHIAAVVDFHI